MRIKLLVPALAIAAIMAMGMLSSQLATGAETEAPAPEGEAYEQAALDYVTWCGPCHGQNAKGNGPVAISLKTPPPDLTGIAARNGGTFPAEAVRERIDGREVPAAHGSLEMPVWGYWFGLEATAGGLLQEDRETAEKEVSRRIGLLVEYLATLQK
jgi:mono/diheme cytochrome c family protein